MRPVRLLGRRENGVLLVEKLYFAIGRQVRAGLVSAMTRQWIPSFD